MTALERLKQKARLLLLLQFLPLLPAGVAWAIAVLSPGSTHAVSAWCAENWWFLLMLGGIPFLIFSISGPWFFLRCPFCKFRFNRAAITGIAFLGVDPAIRHCPHCGLALSNPLRAT
jgi:hypothetical protein